MFCDLLLVGINLYLCKVCQVLHMYCRLWTDAAHVAVQYRIAKAELLPSSIVTFSRCSTQLIADQVVLLRQTSK